MHLYRRIIDHFFHSLSCGSLAIDYWDGTTAHYGSGQPHVGLKLNHPRVFPGLLIHPELTFGEAYMRGAIDLDGEIDDLIHLITGLGNPWPACLQVLANLASAASRLRPLSVDATGAM